MAAQESVTLPGANGDPHEGRDLGVRGRGLGKGGRRVLGKEGRRVLGKEGRRVLGN